MTIAVMQPYVFPYLGYYQLAAAVDSFVFFDDVNYIMKGWINRNRILQQKEPFKFSIPLNKASQNRLINEIEIADYGKWKDSFIKLLEYNYKKAPYFSFTSQWMKQFLDTKDYRMISDLAMDSVSELCGLFKLETSFLRSSAIDYRTEGEQGGQAKIMAICKLLGAGMYVNPKNGMDMYDNATFADNNVALKFIIMDDIQYPQFDNDFHPALSIVDVMMFNDLATIKEMLKKFTLINKQLTV